jgi:hypothetical protein
VQHQVVQQWTGAAHLWLKWPGGAEALTGSRLGRHHHQQQGAGPVLFNANPTKEVSFYASGVDKWWGLSMVVAGPLGISQLLAAG